MTPQQSKIDLWLTGEVPKEQMRPEAKLQLIAIMEKMMHKKSLRAYARFVLPASVFVLVLAFITYAIFDRQQQHYAAGPVGIASDWVREHVQYSFADNLDLPTEIDGLEYEYIPLERYYTDRIAATINPEFLENVQVEDHSVTYSVGESFLTFRQDSYDGEWLPDVHFEYQLFEREPGMEYFEQEAIGVTKEEQRALIENILTENPELTLGYTYEIDPTERPDTSTVRLRIGENQLPEVYTVEFTYGKIFRVTGDALNAVHSITTGVYGSAEDILDDINANPPFFIGSDPKKDVEVQFVFTDYRVTQYGLELYYEMQNPEETLKKGWGITKKTGPSSITNGGTSGWMKILTAEERTQQLEYVEAHRE